jgi:hypothetical protein
MITGTAKRLLWLSALAGLITIGCLISAVIIYALIYWLLIPLQITHRQPVNFRFNYSSRDAIPSATAEALVDFTDNQFHQVRYRP